MSDPVSNSEIEDVLASIRRLVSENARALKRDRERDGDDDKLVLTPAYRIDRSEAPVEEADVFAVDTETWNDAVRKSEAPAEADVFAHSTTSARETAAAATDEPADGDDDAAAPATALERRIAELEQAVDLRAFALEPEAEPIEDAASEPTEAPEAEVDAADAADDADDVAEALAPVADAPDHAVSDTDTDMTAPEVESAADVAEAEVEPAAAAENPGDMSTSEAPPRSWIEGLVFAAASREAARNAAAAPGAPEPREDAIETEGSDETRAETMAEMQDGAVAEVETWAETEPEDVSGAELPDAWAAAAAETDLAVGTDEDEIADDDAVDELTAADETDEYDGAEEADTVADEADADTGDEATEEDDLADAAAAEAVAPTPERSWIDRLITAAAALRGTPPAPAAETETEAGDWDDDQAAEVDPAEDWATDETDVASAPEPWDAAPAADAVEPVEPGWEEGAEDEAGTEETGDAGAPEPEPDEAADNAVVGPWSRPADAGADADADETAEADESGATTLVGVVAFAAAAAKRGYDDDVSAAQAEPEEAADDSAAPLPLGAVVTEVVGRERDHSGAEAELDADEDAEAIASAWREEAEAAEIAYASTEEAGDEASAEAAPDAGAEDPVDADAAAIVAAVEGGSDPDAVEFEWVEAEDIAPQDDAPAQDADAAEEPEPEVEIEARALDTDELDDQDDQDDAAPEPVAAAPGGEADGVQSGLTLASSRPEEASAADVSVSDGLADAADEPAEPDIEVLTDDETILDEAMLRELVAQLVRDELQGTVGERITHNVRRLIRREIARALSLQEFEK